MRTFPAILLCLLFLTLSRTNAQEIFAPLISDNCVAFVHVDLTKADLDAVKNTLQKGGETIFRELNFDDRSFEATARELTVELEKLDMLARPVYDTITKELGIREIALIADGDLLQQGIGSVLTVSWKGKTDADLQKLFSVLPDDEYRDAYLPVGDFLFVAFPNSVKDIQTEKQILTEWTSKKTSAAKSPIFDALKSVEGNEIKIAVAIPESLRDMIKSAPMPPDVPVQVRNLALFAVQKINWASAAVSLRDLFGSNTVGGEPPKNADVFLTVSTTKRSDAVMLRGMLEQLIEFGASAGQFAAQQNPDVQVPPLAFQFGKGLLRTLLPDVEEEKLVFRMKGKNAASKQVVFSAVGVGAALLIPAIQAAREAARRMQCSNHIRQIVLALHNYHDAYDAFPPLYTVDKNGKPLHSWRVLLLPFMGQTGLYSQIRLDEPWDSEHNKQFHDRVISVYHCPSCGNQNGSLCNYSAIAGQVFVPAKKPDAAPFSQDSGKGLGSITDGTSNTIAIVEVKEPFCWMDPTADITLEEFVKGINNGRCGSYHVNGINVGLVDGSVRFVSETIDPKVLCGLATPAGGESVSL